MRKNAFNRENENGNSSNGEELRISNFEIIAWSCFYKRTAHSASTPHNNGNGIELSSSIDSFLQLVYIFGRFGGYKFHFVQLQIN